MRKLLLAGAAGVGALALAMPGASAQTTQITSPTAKNGPVVRNEPGISVRLAGRYRFYAAMVSQDLANHSTVVGGPQVTTGNFDFMDYGRLWFGADGMAANGLRYGAQLEIRMSTGAADARGNTRGVPFYRRMYGYVATPTLGMLRVGSGQVRASELMYSGHMMGKVATGLWDGDFPAAIIGGAGSSSLFWYSSSIGNNMTSIGYYTPQFFGFDAGLSFAPSDGNFGGDGSCGLASVNVANGGMACDRLTRSDMDAATGGRLRNIYDVMLRYRGSFGPVGLVVSGGIVGAGTIGASGNALSYDNVLVGIGGTEVSFAGITVGGIITGGRANYALTTRGNQAQTLATPGNATTAYGQGSPLRPLPSSGNNDNLFTWQIGAKYDIGPFTVGLAYHEAKYEGSIAAPANATDRGLGLGGSYAVAPGISLYAEYLYGRREETGVDLRTGQLGVNNNKATVNLFGLGVGFEW